MLLFLNMVIAIFVINCKSQGHNHKNDSGLIV